MREAKEAPGAQRHLLIRAINFGIQNAVPDPICKQPEASEIAIFSYYADSSTHSEAL